MEYSAIDFVIQKLIILRYHHQVGTTNIFFLFIQKLLLSIEHIIFRNNHNYSVANLLRKRFSRSISVFNDYELLRIFKLNAIRTGEHTDACPLLIYECHHFPNVFP